MIARIAPFIVLVFFVPLLTSAATFCPNLSQDMWYGSCDENIQDTDCVRHTTGAQVSDLQHFLKDYFHNPIGLWLSGYFGNKTKNYVIKFQNDYDVPATGRVGPLTRAAIAQACGTQTTTNPPPQNQSCTTPWGTTIQSGSYVTAYQSSSVPQGQQCVSQTRTCTNGVLTGTFQYQTCSVATTSCIPEQPQTQTLSCPGGQTGSIIQTRTSTCPGPTWGAWTTTSNTCTTTTTNTQPPTVSLLINGQSTITLPPNTTFTVAWSSSNATSCTLTNAQGGVTAITPNTTGSSQGGAPAAGTTWTYTFSCTNSGGTTTKSASVTGQTGGGAGGGGGVIGGAGKLSASPWDGAVPLTVLFGATYSYNIACMFPTFDFGDGASFTPTCAGGFDSSLPVNTTHTYSSPGFYTARLSGAVADPPSTITIAAGGASASASITCTYRGQTYQEGQTIGWSYTGSGPGTHLACDNGAWVTTESFYPELIGENICDGIGTGSPLAVSVRQDLRCTTPFSNIIFAIKARHGPAPFTVTARGTLRAGGDILLAHTINWGDGKSENFPYVTGYDLLRGIPRSHVYATPGSYKITFSSGEGWINSANIRVDPAGTASVQNQSQLANALSALESALKAFLKLLGQ